MKCITIKKGLDLLILGEPNQDDAPERKEVRHVAITGPDYVGMKPTILVEPGEKVLAGQPLLEDKKTPGVKFTSPVAGTVVNVVRGEKRAFRSIIVETAEGDAAKESVAFEKFERGALSELSSEKVREQLIRSGLWTALRTRPFSRPPRIDSVPVALFVNAAD
ncbi:MAG: NADH:ubiquinone reductase (Na(+)-transporting) subunit A, partial [Thermoguttaceae bacterium]|nr:NADH:ubiquinone reductase (Na(+)-transporting) subunit A [Thermoguttaceae bacterium]